MELVRSFHERFGIWLRENWGMTELHGTTTGHFDGTREPLVGSVGRPLPFVRVKAVELDADGHWLRDCAVGERGLLLTGTPTATAGYVDAGLDRDLFPTGVPGELPAGARWASTGDIGMVDETGHVWVFGRAKDLIIRGGHNIDPKEIEDALIAHPAVQLVAAVGRPDLAKGELPVAYVQARDGVVPDPAELRAYCRDHVHERAAVPVEVIVIDEMPLTPVGKIAKPALRADAVTRVVGDIARAHDATATVRIDGTGARLGVDVIVTLPGVEEDLRRAVAGFEFTTRVLLAEGAR
jgi:fatty-acyl-CoA synthase